MDVPVPSDDLLAQPTRARLFELLVDLRTGAETDLLAERLDLHPNGVRRHLERMREGGLVERSRIRGGRGRPRDVWEISPGAHPGGQSPEAYSDLARWLIRSMPASPDRLAKLELAGLGIGRDLASTRSDRQVLPAERFRQVLSSLGFQPELEITEDKSLACRLGNCPYRDSVREDAALICTLHRGITAGLIEGLDPDGKLKRFEPNDPYKAQCLVEVGGGRWGGSADAEDDRGADIGPGPA